MHTHILPFSDFEPLPLYNHVHVPAHEIFCGSRVTIRTRLYLANELEL